MIEHTIAEADKLSMKVDLPPGSGWRIGGPFITEDLAASRILIEIDESANYTAKNQPFVEKVKRPGKGGAGRSFNPFYKKSVQMITEYYSPVFKSLKVSVS